MFIRPPTRTASNTDSTQRLQQLVGRRWPDEVKRHSLGYRFGGCAHYDIRVPGYSRGYISVLFVSVYFEASRLLDGCPACLDHRHHNYHPNRQAAVEGVLKTDGITEQALLASNGSKGDVRSVSAGL